MGSGAVKTIEEVVCVLRVATGARRQGFNYNFEVRSSGA